MTAKIVPFPAQTDHHLTEIDANIRSYLSAMTGDNDLVTHVGGRMKEFIDQYASKTFECKYNIAVPSNMSQQQSDALMRSIEKGIQDTAERMYVIVKKIILERLFLEVQIYITARIMEKQ